MAYETLLLAIDDNVATITLNRPEALNAFNNQLMDDLTACLASLEADLQVRCIVITGSAKAFAAGADIKEMAPKTFADVYGQDFITANWEAVTRCRKPVIAAVAGFALGGGCELAMMCDFIVAADTAKFGQPEIKLGVIPGAGGTQRFAKAAGKAKAMDMILTGRMMDAVEAERCGIVARIVPAENLLEEAHKAAKTIASYGGLSVMAAKEAVDRAFETQRRGPV
jgi:enoyl-CoA hydratase